MFYSSEIYWILVLLSLARIFCTFCFLKKICTSVGLGYLFWGKPQKYIHCCEYTSVHSSRRVRESFPLTGPNQGLVQCQGNKLYIKLSTFRNFSLLVNIIPIVPTSCFPCAAAFYQRSWHCRVLFLNIHGVFFVIIIYPFDIKNIHLS
jgi:hypothetical protein